MSSRSCRSAPDDNRSALLVVGFCAAWCNACAEFRPTFDRIAADRPTNAFVWLDIEDDAGIAGDVDVENFPSIAVYVDGRLIHFGVTLPQAGVIARLVDSFKADSMTIDAGPALRDLPRHLAHRQARDPSPSRASTN